jgi:RNA polymerase sigma factor (sigma-70 family)
MLDAPEALWSAMDAFLAAPRTPASAAGAAALRDLSMLWPSTAARRHRPSSSVESSIMDRLAANPLDSLVRAAAGGDRDAFADVVDRTRTLVCSIAMAILRDVEASQDVAQDVFLSAWRDLRKLREPASFLPWLRQMTRNRAHHVLRSRVRERRVLSDADADVLLEAAIDPATTPAAALIAREDRLRLAEAIDVLPDEAREVVTLFYREGRSVRQVADLLGMREDAVKQRLTRARQRLREALLEEIGETLHATAPGAAFTIAVMAITVSAPATATAAAAAGAGGAGLSASKAAGAGVLAKAATVLLGASGGAIFGGAAVVFGLRALHKQARDQEEASQLKQFAVVAMVTVLIAAAALALVPVWRLGPAASVLTFIAFALALYIEYFRWLPRIIARRLALERLEDPTAAARQQRNEIRRRIGYALGILSGSAGLIWGLIHTAAR